MDNAKLAQIRNHLLRIVNIIDREIDGNADICLHEQDVEDLSTMGSDTNRRFLCNECGKYWEEQIDLKGLQELETIGRRPGTTNGGSQDQEITNGSC